MGAGMITVKGKKVLVIGAGISGISAAALLVKNGAIPIIYDGNEKIKHDEVGVKLSRKIGTAATVQIITGSFSNEVTEEVVLAVLSPGVPTDLSFVQYYKTKSKFTLSKLLAAIFYDTSIANII